VFCGHRYEEFAEAVRALEAGPDASPGTRRQSSGGTPLGPSVRLQPCVLPFLDEALRRCCTNLRWRGDSGLSLSPLYRTVPYLYCTVLYCTYILVRLAPQEDQLHQLARLVDVDGNGRVNIWQFTAAFVAHDSGTHSTSSAGSDDSDFAGAGGFREDMGPEETARKFTFGAGDGGQTLGRQLSHGVVQVRHIHTRTCTHTHTRARDLCRDRMELCVVWLCGMWGTGHH
jgi:hypothetical protein